MSQIDIQPFSKKGRTLTAKNPTRWSLPHWEEPYDVGVAILFDLDTGKKQESGLRVVLLPLQYSREHIFNLDIDPKTEHYALRMRNGKFVQCESLLFSAFVAGRPMFIERFWDNERVSDPDRYAMREAYLVHCKQIAPDKESTRLQIAALCLEIRKRLLEPASKKMLPVKLTADHDFYVLDHGRADRIHRVQPLKAQQQVRIADPYLFSLEYLTPTGSLVVVPCMARIQSKETFGFIPVDEEGDLDDFNHFKGISYVFI